MNFKLLSRTIGALALSALLFFSVLPLTAQAQGTAVFSRKQPTTTAMKLISGDPDRTSVLVQNVGSVIVAVGNTATITYVTGQLLAPNQKALILNYRDALYGITSSGTADLRITESFGAGSMDIQRLITTGISNGASTANTVPMTDGTNLVTPNVLVYMLTTAITANSTVTATVAGTFAITSNATGLGALFVSDGSKWQLMTLYAEQTVQTTSQTIATTSNSDAYIIAPEAGILAGVDFSGIDALAANDTNYITFSITNLGQTGVGSTAMLAATAANTTQVTGGTALSANTKRSLTLHGTAGNLVVAKGDRIRLRYAATGTLANTVTGSIALFRFTRTA